MSERWHAQQVCSLTVCRLEKAERCDPEFHRFSRCLQRNNMDYTLCRKQRIAFENCFDELKD